MSQTSDKESTNETRTILERAQALWERAKSALESDPSEDTEEDETRAAKRLRVATIKHANAEKEKAKAEKAAQNRELDALLAGDAGNEPVVERLRREVVEPIVHIVFDELLPLAVRVDTILADHARAYSRAQRIAGAIGREADVAKNPVHKGNAFGLVHRQLHAERIRRKLPALGQDLADLVQEGE